jgi:Sec-independent protein translocase protein TatA
VGFGTDILFILALGFLFVKPKQLPAILRQIARAKAQFESASKTSSYNWRRKLKSRVRPSAFTLPRNTRKSGRGDSDRITSKI